MTSLKAEPPGPVRSLNEFFALAHAMESDAVARYRETAKLLRQQGAIELAALFEDLAQAERGHVDQVNAWAEHAKAAPPAKSPLPWAIPDTHDAPPDELALSKLLTPYGALASAVRHEERSFAFWTYVAAHAPNEEVKSAAERMALEELEHVATLRRQRRKAFHAEESGKAPPSVSVSLRSLAAFEQKLADYIELHPVMVAGEEFTRNVVAQSRRSAQLITEAATAERPILTLASIPEQKQDDATALSEYLVDAYLRFAEASTDPKMLDLTQDLAAKAICRLATLRLGAAQSTPN
ncbi:MAG: ferritin family protein [Hyphomicrobium sp.]|uniref:ferritin-like domain-containing protein n=1 Tax=Hyphomicrobium sp. TaxID=82 RepID=UPI001323D49C|nr:ferritin family protein [Hyphomicrobium sp.]KAB2940687.1 MAG: ferritin family protein [Hyphomicrobium sp.]MBZ0211544.1 ferritin family protein [Hyphomicrobium sp.]